MSWIISRAPEFELAINEYQSQLAKRRKEAKTSFDGYKVLRDTHDFGQLNIKIEDFENREGDPYGYLDPSEISLGVPLDPDQFFQINAGYLYAYVIRNIGKSQALIFLFRDVK